jgi:CxxC motif-containing protein
VSEQREFICVTCPVGCTIEAIVEGGELMGTKGQACARGQAFVREELSDPRRTLTTTVRVRGGEWPLVPVRSAAPLPKGLVLQVAARLRQVEVAAPVAERQVILPDALGTGIDIVASREVAAAGKERPPA